MYRLDDRFDFTLHVVVPESQNPEALRPEKVIPPNVVCSLLGVLTAVQLHYQSGFETNEVTDVRPDRPLPAKFESIQLATTQEMPEAALGVGSVVAQLAREVAHARKRAGAMRRN
jgi:hypothetical protein